jgi:putative ABC transport system permease protein
MTLVALRGLLAHKLRLVATFLAIALGVAFVGGVLTLTDTMHRSFDDLFAAAYEDTDVVVRSEETLGGGLEDEQQRGTVDAALLDQIRAVDTVAEAEGSVEGYAQIVDREGDVVGGGAFGSPTVASNWTDDENDRNGENAANPGSTTDDAESATFRLREGRAPRAADEAVVDAATARSTGYGIGDTVPVQTPQGLGRYELVGIVGFGSADSPAGSSMVLFTTEEAQRALGKQGRFDAIYVVATAGASQTRVVDDVEGAVGTGVEVLSGRDIVEQSQSDLRSQLSFVTNFFMVFAAVAVLVGAFVIYNAFSIIVAQRTREMALLRAVGASRAQVRRAILVEAVVVGLVGSAAGFVMGLGVASIFTGLLDVDGALAVLPSSVVTAVACGVLVTVASALVPARRAAKVPPVAALRDVAVDTSGRSRLRAAVGIGVIALGVAAVVGGATGEALGLVGLGAVTALVGLLVAGPGLAGPISAAVGWPLARLRGVTGVLAHQNAGRNPRRTASTAQALTIGVGIVAFFLVVNASMRASIDQALDDSFAGDVVVSSGTFGQVGLPTDLAEQVAAMPEVADVAPMRAAPAQVDGDDGDLTATSPAGMDIFGLDVVDGSADLGPGEVVVYEDTAETRGLAVGDRIEVDALDAGSARLTVAGIYSAPSDLANIGSYVVGLDQMATLVPSASDNEVVVDLVDGVSSARAESAIEDVVASYPTAEVQTAEDYKETVVSQLDELLQIVLALVALALVIALLGIANTVALSVLERTRELGLLRAVGMSRSQVRSTIRWESVIIALFGTLLGLAVGVLGGWGVATGWRSEGFAVVDVPVGTLALVATVAGALGMLAALGPAWRAGRLDVLDAIDTV